MQSDTDTLDAGKEARRIAIAVINRLPVSYDRTPDYEAAVEEIAGIVLAAIGEDPTAQLLDSDPVSVELFIAEVRKRIKAGLEPREQIMQGIAGLFGEWTELLEAMDRLPEMIAEAGDVAWYLTEIGIGLQGVFPGQYLQNFTEASIRDATTPCREAPDRRLALGDSFGKLADVLKKVLWHGIEPLDADLTNAYRLAWQRFNRHLLAFRNVSLETVFRANINKLRKRYPIKFETGGGVRE